VRPRPVRRGPKPYPLVRLTSDSHRAIRACGASMTTLAAVGGWHRLPSFSGLLYSDFPASPLTLERLTKLAAVIGLSPDRIIEASR
jgi:hypothetical protein